jgi:hypothetical protein
MDILQLPTLHAVTPVRQAWLILRASRRSAIITMAGDHPVLITAEALALGENRGAKTLAEVEARQVPMIANVSIQPHRSFSEAGIQWAPALETLDQTAIQTHIRETQLGGPHSEIGFDETIQALIDRMLEGIDINFALVGMSPGTAILVSRYESTVRDHAGPPKRCYCENKINVHGYDDRKTGDPCDFDNFKINCRR